MLKALALKTFSNLDCTIYRFAAPVFARLGYSDGTFPVAELTAKKVMSLPMHPYLSDNELIPISAALKEALK